MAATSSQVLRVQLCVFLNSGLVASQCCVSFCCIAKRISYTCTYIPSFFFYFLPIYFTTEHWLELPGLYGRFSLVIYFIHHSVYVNSISQVTSTPFPSLMSICLLSTSVFLFWVQTLDSVVHCLFGSCLWFLFPALWPWANHLHALGLLPHPTGHDNTSLMRLLEGLSKIIKVKNWVKCLAHTILNAEYYDQT